MNDPYDCVKQIHLNDKQLNIWQGNGNVTCSNPLNDMPTAEYAIALQNYPNSSIEIVYHWTIDMIEQMETILFLDIDAIITNYPERVVHVIAANHLLTNRFRLEDHNHLFEKVLIHDGEVPFGKIDNQSINNQLQKSNITPQQILFIKRFYSLQIN